MCGRYQLELSVEDIENLFDLIREVNQRYQRQPATPFVREKQDVYPGSQAIVTTPKGLLHADWGFPLEKKLVFNARTESVFEKPMFKEAVLRDRCLIPATLFYEWNEKKEKHEVRTENTPLLLGGLLRVYPDKDGRPIPRFTILTKASEGPMAAIHPRTPLLLAGANAKAYLQAETPMDILHKIFSGPTPMVSILKDAGPQQLSLF